DLARRDFTVNAIAMTEDGKYIDPHDGRTDLKKMILRAVGNAEARFTEDALRMVRAIRFAIMKGFKLDDQVSYCLNNQKMVDLLDNIS
ncbi:polynucleotide adenylyltransferase, partial [Acinetobacter baumannii]